jgi:hypothetical protein
VGFEDGDLDADDAAAVDRQSEHCLQFGPAQPVGQPVVHRWHQGVVDGVAVEVDPQAGELGASEAGECVPGGALGSALTDRGQVDDCDRGVLDSLAAGRFCLGGIAPPEHHDIFVSDQRSATFEVGEHTWTSARGEREVHRSGLSASFGCWLVEVGVPIDEQQPVPAASAQRQQVAEQDRAVAAEHDRDLATGENLASRRGEEL